MNNAGKAFTTRFIFIHKDLPVFTSYLSWHFLSPLLCFKEIYRFLQRGKERLRCYAYIPLDSSDFVKAFNLRGQLDYQALARNIAEQDVNVIMPGPFEDWTPEIEGMPLYQKMKEVDFRGFDFSVVYVLMHPDKRLTSDEVIDHASMMQIEETIPEFSPKDVRISTYY
jgi:hypothetical protein